MIIVTNTLLLMYPLFLCFNIRNDASQCLSRLTKHYVNLKDNLELLNLITEHDFFG